MDITRQKNYTDWYQEVIKVADLAENSLVRGCMVIKPWGMGTWERIQRLLDEKIKETGHENCYFPLFVPLGLFLKEAAHVDGFAKEMALVTHTRLRIVDGQPKLEGALEEPLVVRPTSETVIAESFAQWIQSYRDLPVLVNQWANVVRWELRPRLFLRTTEFLWQEGHTAHATQAEAQEETMKMLEAYRWLAEEKLALPVIMGEKTPGERFPGAVATYSIEAMMQDGKALQAGTSHYLGQGFAKAANIQFQDKDSQMQFVHTTSWGVSTRLIGAVIMAHADDDGLRLPPAIAPSQVVIVPILRDEADAATVLPFCEALLAQLKAAPGFQGEPLRVKLDKRDRKSQDKRWDWVKKGAPLIVEVGPRDVAKGEVCWVRRDEAAKKNFESGEAFAAKAGSLLTEIQQALFDQAKAFKDKATVRIEDPAAFREYFKKKADFLAKGAPGFVRAYFCGDETALAAVTDLGVTIRNIPFDQPGKPGVCVLTGKPAEQEVIFARSY